MSPQHFTTAVIATATLLFPLLAWAPVTERVKVSGRHTMTVAREHRLVIADHPAHVLFLSEAGGTNRNTGATRWMERSTLISVGSADLVAGTGPHQGYTLEVEGGDTSYVRWSGRVTITMSEDKGPSTSFEGQWTKSGGSGRFRGITGAGTYQGRFTSPTEYTTERSGEIELRKGDTSAR